MKTSNKLHNSTWPPGPDLFLFHVFYSRCAHIGTHAVPCSEHALRVSVALGVSDGALRRCFSGRVEGTRDAGGGCGVSDACVDVQVSRGETRR